jgi:hypothetical protein
MAHARKLTNTPRPNIKPAPQSIPYSNYIKEHCDKVINYQEYLANNINKNAEYNDFIVQSLNGIQTKTPIRGFKIIPAVYDLVSDPSFSSSKLENSNSNETQKLDPDINLGWWCEKNKTSNDFWKYNL